jgi:hypothetical protein
MTYAIRRRFQQLWYDGDGWTCCQADAWKFGTRGDAERVVTGLSLLGCAIEQIAGD